MQRRSNGADDVVPERLTRLVRGTFEDEGEVLEACEWAEKEACICMVLVAAAVNDAGVYVQNMEECL